MLVWLKSVKLIVQKMSSSSLHDSFSHVEFKFTDMTLSCRIQQEKIEYKTQIFLLSRRREGLVPTLVISRMCNRSTCRRCNQCFSFHEDVQHFVVLWVVVCLVFLSTSLDAGFLFAT